MALGAKALTELVGTFVFLAVIALSGAAGPLAPVAVGAGLMAMVYMGGHVSGAHYNPAVTLGLLVRARIGLLQAVVYWPIQLVAACLAFAFAYWVSGRTPGIHPGAHVSALAALASEIVFTTALVLVVLNAAATRATQGNSFYGLAIGFVVAAGAFAVGPISGAAFNPAVGLGATVAAAAWGGGGWSDLWIYFAGPAIGALLAAAIHWVQTVGVELAVAPPQGPPAPGAPAPVPE